MRNWATTSPLVVFVVLLGMLVALELVTGTVHWGQAVIFAAAFTVFLTVVAEVRRRRD